MHNFIVLRYNTHFVSNNPRIFNIEEVRSRTAVNRDIDRTVSGSMTGKSWRHSSRTRPQRGLFCYKDGDERYAIVSVHEKIHILSVVKACIVVKKIFQVDNMIERIGGREKKKKQNSFRSCIFMCGLQNSSTRAMGVAMSVYQTSTRGCSIILLNEHAQFDLRYCSPVADRTRS